MTPSVHDYVGQVVTGHQLNAIGAAVPDTTVLFPLADDADRPWWRERGQWMNGAACADELRDSARFMVLRAPSPQVGDEITSGAMLAALPLTTVVIDSRGMVAQSWIDVVANIDGADVEQVRWSVAAWGESERPDTALDGLTRPVTILHLPTPRKA